MRSIGYKNLINMISAIINLINKWACKHKWDHTIDTAVTTDYGKEYHIHTFICSECGKFKKWSV